ncbi:MAG: CPBP family intramembrane metalloprotease [Myxococcales bacterium]|nr:CPBP family intramembrane metalloprotease [Myxococcales bacterium]
MREGQELAPAAAPGLRLWQALLWVLGAGVAAQLAGGLVATLMRTSLVGAGARAEQLQGSALVILPSMVASMGAMLGITLLSPLLSGRPLGPSLGLRPAHPASYLAAAAGTIALGPLGDLFMRTAEQLWPDATLDAVPMLRQLVQDSPLLYVWPVVALMPGLCEELLFRGLLQRAAPPGFAAITVSAVSFALFHVDPHHIAGVLPLGLFLAWVAERHGTWVSIVAHVANNSAAIAATSSAQFDVGYGTDVEMPLWWMLPGLGIAALCARVLVKLPARTA